jgi:hypothetical protein
MVKFRIEIRWNDKISELFGGDTDFVDAASIDFELIRMWLHKITPIEVILQQKSKSEFETWENITTWKCDACKL